MAKEHQGASLPKELLRRIEYIINETDLGYTSKADFIKEAVRQKLDEVERKLLELEKLKKELKER
jgi:metal-responsive CopG/Arc/MetJ family transcriptional regulator